MKWLVVRIILLIYTLNMLYGAQAYAYTPSPMIDQKVFQESNSRCDMVNKIWEFRAKPLDNDSRFSSSSSSSDKNND